MTETGYEDIIDAETWAFIHASGAHVPVEPGINGQRAAYDAMCRALHHGRPPCVRVSDVPVGGVPARIYEGSAPAGTIVYFHGGGFVLGGLHSHDDICAEIATICEARVVSVDYRLAPEHPHPAAFEDALAAVRAARAAYAGPLVLAGDSAGANLVAAVAHATRRQTPAPAGQVLIYPALGGDPDRGSYLTHAQAPMLTRAQLLEYEALRAGGQPDRSDPTAAPLADSTFAGLPPTILFAAECDPLADDARDYHDRIRAEGGEAQCTVEAGLVHGYLRARHSVGRARASFARITGALAGLVQSGGAA